MVSIVNPDLTYVLTCMYEKRKATGEGYFFDVNEGSPPLLLPTEQRTVNRRNQVFFKNGNYRLSIYFIQKKSPVKKTVITGSSSISDFNYVDDYFVTKKPIKKNPSINEANFCFTVPQ